ncbi:carbohydrate ABC transporter permease [Murimonas intestini]|uniref:Carbohydrate ABC transporter membrane protein 1 (CUT1 family) n=1 Tax=Murimonas intestini TaxID=1337051 RepID=A0AB73T7E5_9FIRM|nr:sugar ABC transporter permease [Murimonas intestini]MCR1841280.1 sugar ABC transporter permease [Murimonas intestini]MCR1866198.1 sugar ABC transporter permease [Murimonas intestini]MCR1882685.1 sugar ABC transporter permease [Murimonas intestini]
MGKKKLKDRSLPYLMILPSVILLLGIFGYPILKVFMLSLQNYNYADYANKGFAGLENFRKIFTEDTVIKESLVFSLKWVVSEVGLQLVFGMILALILNARFKGRGAVRALALIPWAVSGVLTTMLWMLILNQSIGLVNQLLIRFGSMPGEVPAWLANTGLIFPSIVVIELWRGIPFFAITLLAAMQGIPSDVYEACDIDGAGKTARFRYITLPYLKETIVLTTLLRAIWEFNSTDMIFTLTNGGPVNMTTTLPIYMLKTAVVSGNYGYGSALGVIAFVILLVFAVLYMKASRFGGEDNE